MAGGDPLGLASTARHDAAEDLGSAITQPQNGEAQSHTLRRGATFDRYMILGALGAGGMGVVYAAYDPDLDRKVAIKLLHPNATGEADPGQGRARLLREAKAIARLAHPNVIAVHDAKTAGDDVFVVMELVDGQTLSEWLASSDRSCPEIVSMFVQAGRGLAAAHAAKLVHRDFKPENVIVGKDGRARVLDFGLARPPGGRESARWKVPSGDEPVREPTAQITDPGAIVGTLAYMAPEQMLGEAPDPRTDQFSFCVALYEALYGERPFAGDSLAAVLKAMTTGKVRESPKGTVVSPWVRSVLVRGLAADRERRFASMDALLDALEPKGDGRRRRYGAWLLASGVVAAMSATLVIRSQTPPPSSCADEKAMLAGVWDDDVRAGVHRAFVASGAPLAEDGFRRIEPMLNAYAARWTAANAEACRAAEREPRKGPAPDDESTGFRLACLDRQRLALKALTSLFARADAQVVGRSAEATYALTEPNECRDGAALRAAAGLPDDPKQRTGVLAVRTRLAESQSLLSAGKVNEAEEILTPTLAATRAIPHADSEAEALLLLGQVQERRGAFRSAVDWYKLALSTAERAGYDRVVAISATRLTFVAGEKELRFDEAHAWALLAEAARQRLAPSEELEADVLQAKAVLTVAEGHADEALPMLEEVLKIRRHTVGAVHPETLKALNNLGYAEQLVGTPDQAFALHREATVLREKNMGADPVLAIDYSNLGSSSIDAGRYREGREYLDAAMDFAARANPESFWIAWALMYASRAELCMNHPTLGLEVAQRGLRLAESRTPLARTVPPLLVDEGEALIRLGRYGEALAACQRALTLQDPRLVSPDVIYEWDSLTCIGNARLGMGQPREALEALERSAAITRRVRAGDLALARFALARALIATRTGPERSQDLLRQARTELESLPHRRADLEQVAEWSASH